MTPHYEDFFAFPWSREPAQPAGGSLDPVCQLNPEKKCGLMRNRMFVDLNKYGPHVGRDSGGGIGVRERTSGARECMCHDHAQEAKLIQSSLVPTKGVYHESVEIAFGFAPFAEVGGDFLDFFRLPDG
jgi:hypothetical protein